jgi:hypothetical protein
MQTARGCSGWTRAPRSRDPSASTFPVAGRDLTVTWVMRRAKGSREIIFAAYRLRQVALRCLRSAPSGVSQSWVAVDDCSLPFASASKAWTGQRSPEIERWRTTPWPRRSHYFGGSVRIPGTTPSPNLRQNLR